MRFLRTNTAVIVTVGPFYDKTDGVTIETALTITNERITLTADTDDGSAPTNILDNITGATSGTSNDLNYITGNDAGMMQLELSAANTNRLGRMYLSVTDAANHVPVFHEFMVVNAALYDAFFATSGGAIPNAVAGASAGLLISGSNAGTTTLAALTVTGATTLTGNVALADGLTIAAPSTTNRAGLDITGNGTGAAMKLAAGATGNGIAITTTAGDGLSILPTAGDAIVATANGTSKHGIRATGGTGGTSDGISAIAGTGGVPIRGDITGNITGNLSGSAGSVSGAVGSVTATVNANVTQISGDSTAADNLETAYDDTPGPVRWHGVVDQGTLQSATASTAVLRSALALASDVANGAQLEIVSGTGAGQTRGVADYDGSTDTVTVDSDWTVTPDNTSGYILWASAPLPTALPAVNVTQWLGTAVSTPTVAGVPNVNTKTWNDLATVDLPLAPTTAGRKLDVSVGGEAGVDWANVGNQTTTLNLSGTTVKTATDIATQIAALNNLSASQVNAEVVDALATDTYAEPGQGAPAATASIAAKINYLFKAWRNRYTQTATEYKLYGDDATTVDQKATVSDDTTTLDRGEIATGP